MSAIIEITQRVANAFYDQKNIPPKHQDYMKESRFLTVYCAIEVDEDQILTKMQELEKELLCSWGYFGKKHPMMLPFIPQAWPTPCFRPLFPGLPVRMH